MTEFNEGDLHHFKNIGEKIYKLAMDCEPWNLTDLEELRECILELAQYTHKLSDWISETSCR